MNDYAFNVFNSYASCGIALALKNQFNIQTAIPNTQTAKNQTDCKQTKFIQGQPPVLLCIGSDLSVGDSLGPVTGTKLKEKLRGTNCYVYGTLTKPITAHEVKYLNDFIHSTHPHSPVIAIDAAVGANGDIGLIRVTKKGLKPGSGANKKLARVGDVSIMGIVAEKSVFNFSILSATRLSLVYKMAELIAAGVTDYITQTLQNRVEI